MDKLAPFEQNQQVNKYMQALGIQKLWDFLHQNHQLLLTVAYRHFWLLLWLSYRNMERMSVWIYTLPLSIAVAYFFSIASGFPTSKGGEDCNPSCPKKELISYCDVFQKYEVEEGKNRSWAEFQKCLFFKIYQQCRVFLLWSFVGGGLPPFPPPVLQTVETWLPVGVFSYLVPALYCYNYYDFYWGL